MHGPHVKTDNGKRKANAAGVKVTAATVEVQVANLLDSQVNGVADVG